MTNIPLTRMMSLGWLGIRFHKDHTMQDVSAGQRETQVFIQVSFVCRETTNQCI